MGIENFGCNFPWGGRRRELGDCRCCIFSLVVYLFVELVLSWGCVGGFGLVEGE